MKIGLDVGSTTIKCVVLDEQSKIIYKTYERHYSQITQKIRDILNYINKNIENSEKAHIALSGSAGMGVANFCGIQFVQEVFATKVAANTYEPQTDVIIELGGEDAKILFLSGSMEVRMNGSCAGGTGAFIDQMAMLLNVPLEGMDALASEYEKTYTIASRCGVFAKTDIQPLLNQGARKSDIAQSIFLAVVNQTVAGLAQGREIKGNVLYLGGPLTFMSQLRNRFDKVLNTTGLCPENSLYYVASGAALCAEETLDIEKTLEKLESYSTQENFACNDPLFKDENEYSEFVKRHSKATVDKLDIKSYKGDVFIGIDAGSTTVKAVVIGTKNELLFSRYLPNSGNPIPIIKDFLIELYKTAKDINIKGGCVTGYGEEIIKNAFCIDYGIVETVAHFTAAKHFMPEVEFVIDIGGQDIKCFKIHSGNIDNIFLNEACSSGCGSFLQTFANTLGYPIDKFAKIGLLAKKPVDLGSRCTVFMNSSVKQAQKDGATVEDISAGLSISVVKNAIYKVIRASSPNELGKNIVVQGGTFLNDAVLRSFEKEMGVQVVRPEIAGLMGAYGCALFAKEKAENKKENSSVLDLNNLEHFIHEIKVANCGLCSNNCKLTINKFAQGRNFIAGNRCERPVTKKKSLSDLNIYDYKLEQIKSYKPVVGSRGKIGIPLGLNMYELLPFWHTFFTSLGFECINSGISDSKTYSRGQQTIPSDTVCYPAKLVHGHIKDLVKQGVDVIFYPCLSYNLDENLGDNHYNCPVVAYYPEVIGANMSDVENIIFIKDYLGIHRKKDFVKKPNEMV